MSINFKDPQGYVKSNTETYSNLRILPIRNFTRKDITIRFQVRQNLLKTV